jgi:hypothetical protein
MVTVNVTHRVSSIQVDVAIELDVQNYHDIVKQEKGGLVGMFAGLGAVRDRVDTTIHDQVRTSVEAGLEERVRPELIERLRESVHASLTNSLAEELAKNGVEADVRVSVDAR